jgi:branched-chain amino acid transport system ATP-binding protein
MLEIHDLSVSYRGLAALRGVSLTVEEGQFVAIVGPNGAGKTTLFKAISGTVRQDRLRPPRNTAAGPRASLHCPCACGAAGLRLDDRARKPRNGCYAFCGRPELQRNLDRIYVLFAVLAERRSQLVGTLSGGEQQMGTAWHPRRASCCSTSRLWGWRRL